MTIGIAIPTYVGHIHLLERLIDSIAQSTVMPTEVAISMSEISEIPTFLGKKSYPFVVNCHVWGTKMNVAQNTNTALSMLTTDILSVIGGDDMMHPQRCDFLLRAFQNRQVDIVVHNFLQSDHVNEDFLKSRYDLMELYIDYIDTVFPNQIYPSNKKEHLDFANGFISFRSGIFERFKYDESPESEYIEDSLYTRALVEAGYGISYIKQKLVLYLKNPYRKP